MWKEKEPDLKQEASLRREGGGKPSPRLKGDSQIFKLGHWNDEDKDSKLKEEVASIGEEMRGNLVEKRWNQDLY